MYVGSYTPMHVCVYVYICMYLRYSEPATPEGYCGVCVVHMGGSGNGNTQGWWRTVVDLHTYDTEWSSRPSTSECMPVHCTQNYKHMHGNTRSREFMWVDYEHERQTAKYAYFPCLNSWGLFTHSHLWWQQHDVWLFPQYSFPRNLKHFTTETV